MSVCPIAVRLELTEPRLHRADVGEAPARDGRAGTDFDRMATQRIHDFEAVLVGHVVSDENRYSALERIFVHEILHRGPLVTTARLELDDALAGENGVLG